MASEDRGEKVIGMEQLKMPFSVMRLDNARAPRRDSSFMVGTDFFLAKTTRIIYYYSLKKVFNIKCYYFKE